MVIENLYIILALLLIGVLAIIFYNPYKYPYYHLSLDVSNKRNVDIEEEIENYILTFGFDEIVKHESEVREWEQLSEYRISRSRFKMLRKRQYAEVRDDENTYVVTLQRKRTRYSQRNYVRTPYTVYIISQELHLSYEELSKYYHKLDEIGFETTTKKYYSKNQRKLMTPELRLKIKERDSYTCQICGKVMYDEVGLHIDHIHPVSKGGKTVVSNLQVLCSKCNGRKSNR